MSYGKKSKKYKKAAPSAINYKGRVEFLRRWMPTGFNKSDGYDLRQYANWSSSRKRIINEYYDALQQLTSRAVYVYSPRSKEKQKIARESMGLGYLKKLTRAYIQVPTHINDKGEIKPTAPKVKIKGGVLTTDFKGFARDVILFERYGYSDEKVAEDPRGVITDIVSQLDYNQYTVIAGLHEVGKGAPQMMSRDNIADKVSKLIEKYDKDDDHNWRDWLFGVIGYRFHPRSDVLHYVTTIKEQSKRKKEVTALIAVIKKKIDYRLDKIRLLGYNRKLTLEKKLKIEFRLQQEINHFELEINELIIKRSKGL